MIPILIEVELSRRVVSPQTLELGLSVFILFVFVEETKNSALSVLTLEISPGDPKA